MSRKITTFGTVARRAIAGVTLALGSFFILAAPTGVAFAVNEQIVAVLDGEPITETDVGQRLKSPTPMSRRFTRQWRNA